ncbi:MAG: SDR family oxidoreductase, partial [Myxococcales bacterium]|nr:SDR family oxidoreductase [Myxococcales bacterium]
PAELGKLRTLQEIVDRMGSATGSAMPVVETTTKTDAAPVAARYALRLVDAPASGMSLTYLLSCKRLVIVDDGDGVGPALAAELSARGVVAEVVREVPNGADGVIFLGGLRSFATTDEALAIAREAFVAAKAVAAHLTNEPGVFVTVQDTGGDFGLGGGPRAWLGGLPGLVKSAALEWPHAGLRAVDLERANRAPEALARALAVELLQGGAPIGDGLSGGGREVALLADGTRRTLQSFAADVTGGASRITDLDVVLASGGARGVTATTLIALAQATHCKLVLVGRTPLADEPVAVAHAKTDAEIKSALLADAKASGTKVSPAELGKRASSILATREVRETLSAIEAAGGQARYVAADVQDRAALDAALADVRATWGKVTAIVHGAGVLADRFLADKTLEQFDRVFDVKVRGLRALLEATANDDVRVLLNFSSVAGRCGNRGQSDYAMANETLNKVAAQLAHSRGVFARSFGWGPWEGGMVTPALEQHFRAMGVPLIPLEVGAKMLVDELTDASTSVELVLGGEPKPDALAPTSGPKERRFEVLIDRAGFPMIDDHRVKGQPVLPAAMALELFARAARATRPELVLTSCEELRVLRGVVLEGYEGAGDRFVIESKQISNGDGVRLALTLADTQGRPRYSAQATLARRAASATSAPQTPSGLARFDRVVYDGVALFHGEAFRVLDGTPDVGDAGANATMLGGLDKNWPTAAWETDPALIDGALQLALLFTTFDEGGAALPTSIASVHRYRSGLVAGPLRAVLVGHERRGDKTRSDVVIVDAEGVVVVELRGVEMHVLPGSRDRRPSSSV